MPPIDYSKWDNINSDDDDAGPTQSPPASPTIAPSEPAGPKPQLPKPTPAAGFDMDEPALQKIQSKMNAQFGFDVPFSRDEARKIPAHHREAVIQSTLKLLPELLKDPSTRKLTEATLRHAPADELNFPPSYFRAEREKHNKKWDQVINALLTHPVLAWTPKNDCSHMENFMDAINTWFSKGSEAAAHLADALDYAQMKFDNYTVYRDSFPLILDPFELQSRGRMIDGGTMSKLVMTLALPDTPQATESFKSWLGANGPGPLRVEKAANLNIVLKQVQHRLLHQTEDALEVLMVALSDAKMELSFTGVMEEELGTTWKPNRVFVVAAVRGGCRILQSGVGSSGYEDLPTYMRKGGHRLRSWEEMKEWLKVFKIVSTPMARFTLQTARAWKACFEVDWVNAINGPFPPQGIRYTPLVRVYRISDAQPKNLAKPVWNLKEFGEPQP